jgi:hypothetical protein
MTQWIDDPTGGRDRGPIAVARAWGELLVRPRTFFRNGVAPGDQAPGLVFAMGVVLIVELTRIALVPEPYPTFGAPPLLATVVWLAVAVMLVTPAALHLAAAIETVGLMLMVDDRAGVSETVQILGYSGAPCVVAGVPVVEVRALATVWATGLLVFGIYILHDTTVKRSIAASVVPASLLFGYGLRGFAAIGEVLAGWYII